LNRLLVLLIPVGLSTAQAESLSLKTRSIHLGPGYLAKSETPWLASISSKDKFSVNYSRPDDEARDE